MKIELFEERVTQGVNLHLMIVKSFFRLVKSKKKADVLKSFKFYFESYINTDKISVFFLQIKLSLTPTVKN